MRELHREDPEALVRLRAHLDAHGLSPRRLLARRRPVAFVDLVFGGKTFGNLARVLRTWARERWPAVERRLVWVCLTEACHPRFDRWRPLESAWTRGADGALRLHLGQRRRRRLAALLEPSSLAFALGRN